MSGENPEPTGLTRAIAVQLDAAYQRRKRVDGLSQTRLGGSIGLGQSEVSRILCGLKPIYVEHLDALCTHLGLDVAEVVDTAKRTAREV